MKKVLCAILSSVILFTVVLSTPVRAEAVVPPSPSDIIALANIFVSLLSIWNSNKTAENRANIDAMWKASPDFNRSIQLDADQLWRIQAQLTESGNNCEIYSSTYNGLTAYYIRGVAFANIPQVNQNVTWYIKYIGTEFQLQDKFFCNEQGYVLYSRHYPSSYTLSSINMRVTSYLQNIQSAISATNQKLDNIYSALTGQSSVMAEARSIIEQLSVYTSSSDLSNAAKQYWSRTFVDPSSNFSMVYVTYEDLSQLVVELANIGVTTRIYKDEAKGVYVIRDVGAWIVDPNTRSDYYSSSAAADVQYRFYQHYFSLGRGQVICSTFPSLSLLLNDLNLRIVTLYYSIENGFSSLDNSISSLGVDVSAILEYLTDHEPRQTLFYVKNVYAAGSSYRIIPYESMMQMLADINVNYLDAPCYIDGVGDGFFTSSASMSSSFNIAENDYYSLIVRYREAGTSNEQVGRLCDSTGAMFRAYQKDNYPFRILKKLDDIYNWLDSADLITSDDIEEMKEKSNSKVYKFLKFTNRFLGVFNDVFDFDLTLSDWSSIHEYLSHTGRD